MTDLKPGNRVAYIAKRTVDAAKPGPVDYILWDSALRGFGLKVTRAGSKVYVFRYRLALPGRASTTAPRKYTIGKHGGLTAEAARKIAKALEIKVAQGIDPMQEEADRRAAEVKAIQLAQERARLEADLSFQNVAQQWLEHYENEGRRPRTVAQARDIVNGHLLPALKGRPVPSVTGQDLQRIIDRVPVRHRATRRAIYAYASVLMQWAMVRGYIAENPARKMLKPSGPPARDRVLSDDEIVAVWNATGELQSPFREYFRVLMLTGQRREEAAGMRWSELDRASATWIIPAERAKNGSAHIVPLAPAVMEEIDKLALAVQLKAEEPEPDGTRWPKSGPVMSIRGAKPLSCYSQAKRSLDAKVSEHRNEAPPIPAWRVHDMRRTLATGLQRLGVRFEVTEAVLNHVSGARAGVAGIYQKHDWRIEKRDALRSWAAHVATLAAGNRPSDFISESGEADAEAWVRHVRDCADNGGKPVKRSDGNVVPLRQRVSEGAAR